MKYLSLRANMDSNESKTYLVRYRLAGDASEREICIDSHSSGRLEELLSNYLKNNCRFFGEFVITNIEEDSNRFSVIISW